MWRNRDWVQLAPVKLQSEPRPENRCQLLVHAEIHLAHLIHRSTETIRELSILLHMNFGAYCSFPA